jgi:hypothetical protein
METNETSDSVEIIGLGESLTVDADLNISPTSAADEQDVMADMRLAVADLVPEPKAAVPAADEPAGDETKDNADEAKPAEEKPAAEAPTGEDKPADDEAPEEKSLEKPAEEKPAEKADEPKDEEEAKPEAEEEKAEVEPSESDKLVEELGGVEVLKAAQPFVESVYDPELPVSERVSRLEAFVPEAQMTAMRNEIFWQAAETSEIQDMLKRDPDIQNLIAGDPEAREAFAQKVFGVPFAFLEHAFTTDVKPFYEAEQIEEIAKERAKAAGEEGKTEEPVAKTKPAVKAAPKAEKPTAPEKEESKSEPDVLTPAFVEILDDLAKDVETIFSTAQLDIVEGDDDDTKRLKTEADQKFQSEWAKAFLADEAAMKAYRTVKGLADQGAETQARQKYSLLSKHGKRVAATLLEQVSQPLATHRQALQKKGKAAAAARTETPGAVKDKPFSAPAKSGVDVSALKSDADIARAMEDSITRNTKG